MPEIQRRKYSAGKAVPVVAFGRTQYERFRRPVHEFAKFAVVGIAGVFVTNGVYDLFALATLFRFWSYRLFVWGAPAAPSPPSYPATPAGQHART